MKKQTRSFTVEVKRSRFTSPSSPLQRFVLPDPLPQHPKPGPLSPPFTEEPAAPVPPQRRVLPSLVPDKVWSSADDSETEHPLPSSQVAALELERDPNATRDAEAARDDQDQPGASQRVRAKRPLWAPRSAEDLPRGQRWKRRLPKITW